MSTTHRERGYHACHGSTASAHQLGSSQSMDCFYQVQNIKKNINITAIQCYAPTNVLDCKKEEFYDRLQSVLNRPSDKDINLLMGDLNAKLGDVNTRYEQVMAAHGLGRMDKNGELFADFCAQDSLAIGGSVFERRRIHEAT